MVPAVTVSAFVGAARDGKPELAAAILRGSCLFHSPGRLRPEEVGSPEHFLEVVLATIDVR